MRKCEYCGAELELYTRCNCDGAIAGRAKRDAEIKAEIKAKKAAERKRLYRAMGLTGRLASSTFDTLKPRANWAAFGGLVKQCKVYAADPQKWLVLQGNYGTGKSHIAAAIIRTQLDTGGRGRFVVWTEYLESIKTSWGHNDGETERLQDKLKTRGLLVLDDIDKKRGTEWAIERLFDVINYRYNEQLPTIITLNHPLGELARYTSKAIADRIIGESLWLVFDGESYRSGVKY